MIHVFHHNDHDGFACAYAAWEKFGPNANFYEVNYGPAADAEFEKLMGTVQPEDEVYVLDFSFSRELTEKMAARCKLKVIDHHEGARLKLEGLPYCHVDVSHAACVLAWKHFHPDWDVDGDVPELLKYVEDRDLWKFQLPFSKEVSAGLFLKAKNFLAWKCHLNDVSDLRNMGISVIAYEYNLIENAIKHAEIHEFFGYKVPVLNCTFSVSEVCNKLRAKYPEAPFAVVYYDTYHSKEKTWSRKYSLRSDGVFDVSAFCRQFGGDGHKGAAGFSQLITRTTWQKEPSIV